MSLRPNQFLCRKILQLVQIDFPLCKPSSAKASNICQYL